LNYVNGGGGEKKERNKYVKGTEERREGNENTGNELFSRELKTVRV